MRRGWSTAAIVATSYGLVTMLGFRFALAVKGLRVMDLWNWARPLASPPNAETTRLVNLGSNLAGLAFYLALLTLPYCLIVGGLAGRRRDARTAIVMGICLVMAMVYGSLAFQLGLIIAGV